MQDKLIAIKDKISGGKVIYEGNRRRTFCQVIVRTEPGGVMLRKLSPKLSQELYNHSPDGFNWGYGGSGPAQLALAILLDTTGDKEISLHYYQVFKWMKVAKWGDKWEISQVDILDFLVYLSESEPPTRVHYHME